MADLQRMQRNGEEIERRLRLQTFPIAIKLLRSEEDIPEGAVRPKKALGYHLLLCQAFQISRRMGITVAMLKEDMWCFEPVIGYGLAEPPQYFLDGYNRFPDDVETLEAGSNYAHEFPRLETGKYIGVVSAPLMTANFEPDVVMIYCNPAQLTVLLLASEYKDGHSLTSTLSGHAACVYPIVASIQDRKSQVAMPCRGDRCLAMAGDDELIFTVPIEKLEDLLSGLKGIEQTAGSKLPVVRGIMLEPEVLPESYMKIGRMVGLDTVSKRVGKTVGLDTISRDG